MSIHVTILGLAVGFLAVVALITWCVVKFRGRDE